NSGFAPSGNSILRSSWVSDVVSDVVSPTVSDGLVSPPPPRIPGGLSVLCACGWDGASDAWSCGGDMPSTTGLVAASWLSIVFSSSSLQVFLEHFCHHSRVLARCHHL